MTTPVAARPVLRFEDGGSAEAIGGHLALELVNTVAWRLDPTRTVDRIVDPPALVRWARWIGLVDGAEGAGLERGLLGDPAAGTRALGRVRRLREELHHVVQPLATGAEPSRRDVEALHRTLLGALGRARVASVMPLEWAADPTAPGGLEDGLALHAWRFLAREDPGRVRQCRDDGCGWLFLDRTRNGSRVWCSSADCGNRSRARRHYRRARAAGGGAPGTGPR